jgi:hypothetical protein
VPRFCERGTEFLGPIKGRDFVNQLGNYQLLRKYLLRGVSYIANI